MNELKNSNFIKKNSIDNSIFDNVLTFIDPDLSGLLHNIPNTYKDSIEELRMRVGNPLMLFAKGRDYFITTDGDLTDTLHNNSYILSLVNIHNTFRLISDYSVYAFEEEIKNGFITIKGGHRVGVAGKVVYGNRGIETIKNISSLNIRIAREKIGISDSIMQYLIRKTHSCYNTLIVSPPQCGKTTLLRDIVRNISNGMPRYHFRGLKVGVVDERSEIAGIYNGQPQNRIGIRTDILDGCPKYDGMILLIRSMSPHVIATDELGDAKDIQAIHEALKTGVKLVSTVHGESMEDLRTKPNLKKILNEKIFERIILLDNSEGVGTIKEIIDGKNFKAIFLKEGNSYDIS